MRKAAKFLAAAVVFAGMTTGVWAQHVGLAGSGYWADPPVYQGNVINYNARHVWIDIWVHNLGYEKNVGIVWTDNNWATVNWADAQYEMTYADGAERWGVDLMPVGTFMWHRSGAHEWISLDDTSQYLGSAEKYIEFAVYYHDPYTGTMYWDNNDGWNHWQLVAPGNGW